MCGLCGFGLADAELVLGRDAASDLPETKVSGGRSSGEIAPASSNGCVRPNSAGCNAAETIAAAPGFGFGSILAARLMQFARLLALRPIYLRSR